MTSVLTRVRVGEHLLVDEFEVDGTLIAGLTGELDLNGAPDLAAYFKELADRDKNVLVDLSGLEFLNATGVSALLAGENAVESAGNRFTVRGASGTVRMVLTLANVEIAD